VIRNFIQFIMKPYLVLLAVLLAFTPVFAQKNAPVAGQASVLADLLKKDYSAIDPDLVGDQLVADRAQVISIFKSFLITTTYSDYGATANLTNTASLASKATNAYLEAKKANNASSVTSISTSTAAVLKTADSIAQAKVANYNAARTDYYTAKFVSDVEQLKLLVFLFQKDQGQHSFIADVIQLFIQKYDAISDSQSDYFAAINPNSSINKALPVLGAFGSTTEIIDGLSKFLAKRIKEELTTFAVQNIQTWLTQHSKTTPTEELLVLFPSTAAYLMKFDADKVTSFPAEIKQYIESDLNHLLDDGYKLKNTTLFAGLIKKYPDLELAFEAFHLVPQLTKLKNPSNFISVLNASDFMATLNNKIDPVSVNIVGSLSFLELISNSLTITNNGEPQYTTVDFWGTYGREIPFMKLYLGFLYQQDAKYYKINFSINNQELWLGAQLSDLMSNADSFNNKITLLQPVLTDICKNAESIYDQAQNLRKLNNAGQKLGADTIFSFNKSVIDFARDLGNDADKVIAVFLIDTANKPQIAQKISHFITIADTANDAIRNIYDKKYAQGILELLQLAFDLVPQHQLQMASEYLQLYNFTQIKADDSWRNWTAISNLVGGTATGPQVVSAKSVATELHAISAFYRKNGKPDQSLTKKINELISALQGIAAGHAIDPNVVSKIRALFDNEDLQVAAVSYYLKFNVADAAINLEAKMQQDFDNGSAGVTKADLKAFDTNIQAYIKLFFDVRIIQSNTVVGDLNNQEELVKTVIVDYAQTLQSSGGYKLDPRIVSLVHFINDMALAKNSDDVEQAIEAFALPAGSYSIKQKSIYTLTLNAFPGIIGGNELTTGHKVAGSIGFTAPVGLNMTWGRVWKNWTLGAFVPVIDIGAVTRYRLDSDNDTKALPDVTWGNFFSPGLFLTIGIGKTPFSINLGAQYGPQVKDINKSPVASTWLLGGAITIDIPLFNIYNRPFDK